VYHNIGRPGRNRSASCAGFACTRLLRSSLLSWLRAQDNADRHRRRGRVDPRFCCPRFCAPISNAGRPLILQHRASGLARSTMLPHSPSGQPARFCTFNWNCWSVSDRPCTVRPTGPHALGADCGYPSEGARLRLVSRCVSNQDPHRVVHLRDRLALADPVCGNRVRARFLWHSW